MKPKRSTHPLYSAQADYRTAWEELEAWKKIEAERLLEAWEEDEKREAEREMQYLGYLLEEEEEENRRQICESQGLSRWC